MSGRLQGGSAGESVRGGQNRFFHSGVKAFEPQTKNTYGIRVLPAFEYDANMSVVSPTSFIPYRFPDQLDTQSQKEKFTPWYFPLKGYKFVGHGKEAFLSPLTRYQQDKRGVDPLFDCYLLARTSKDSRPDWYKLTEKAQGAKNAVIENFRSFGAMNVVLDGGQGTIENKIMVITGASLRDFKGQLDMLTPWGAQPLDPMWPKYLLGDITSPSSGLWGIVKEGTIDAGGMKMKTCLLSFSQSRDQLIGHRPWPIDVNQAWGQAYLTGRYNIADTEKVTRIPEGEEILQLIVDDGFLPIELIHQACSDHWSIPASRTGRTFSHANPPPAHGNEDGDLGPQNREFWLLSPTGQPSTQPVKEAQVRAMVQATRIELTVCLVGTAEWKPTSAYGISPIQAVTPPPPPPSAARVIAPPAPNGYQAPPAGPSGYAPAPTPAPTPAPAPAPYTPSAPPSGPAQTPVPYTPAAPSPGAPPAPQWPQQPTAPGGYTPPPPGPGAPPPSPGAGRPVPQQPMAPPPPPSGTPSVVQAAHAPPAGSAHPMHHQPPPANTAPAPQPAQAPVAAPASAPVPMTEQERQELLALEQKWQTVMESGGEMLPTDLNRYASLSDRYQALKTAGMA